MPNRFQWDYPTQGLVFPRTLEQAFGPGARLDTHKPLKTDSLAYAAAVVLAVSALTLLIN
jgi:hypothetical protein